MRDTRIVTIEWARLEGERPRAAGCNARMGAHGRRVGSPIARITTEEGLSGFGWSQISEEGAGELVGLALDDAGVSNGAVRERFRALEYPILDLVGKLARQPVYVLLGGQPDADGVYRTPCYDTSLYMDDLHLRDDDAGAALIASEAMEGYERGHRAFKIKVGRGAMHMPLQAGTRRDIAVIRAVREAVGPGSRIMIDANNGYNVNLAKWVLGETADAGVYWLEEAFHEDARLYQHLREWLDREGLETLIADGEGSASPHLLAWAARGLVDVVQYDVRRPGFSRWVELGPQLDAAGVRSAPHHYGEPYGNYAACHLAAVIRRFEAVEWDEATVPGLDASAYAIHEGMVSVPDLPGFGLDLDEDVFGRAVAASGFVVGI
jgi:L-alanine-DL-glutamate epimerase-like enolase superfamily enzyme